MTSPQSPKTGSALAYGELDARLNRGEIFRTGSWLPGNLRAAGYDLRIAEDFLIVPDRDHPRGRRYARGSKRAEPIILKSGDVAFASTMERMCIPWDLTGNIGIKFGLARKGVLVLTGLLVDPGFGLQKIGDTWLPKNDERVHFLLANVGPNEIVLEPGKTKIASIQFFSVCGEVQQKEVLSTVDMQDEFFSSNEAPRLGLSFFREMADMKSQFHEFGTRIDVIERGTNQVVMFGIYLLGVTFLTGLVATLLGLVSSDSLRWKAEQMAKALPQSWPGALSLASLCTTLLLLPNAAARLYAAAKLLRRKAPNNQDV